ncbi:glycerophosphodiester phosphodiesterase [Paenibacillus senegalensis]|uniref:glycerophosphodiester phosphodiesterase n=1 Tax=Paenibacillus senegalensis TaxID=1465766 RepID=UPI0002895DAD|nr:glycerophosphodiester phosphodiesterase [Paenibacillus senegalensis]
MSTSKPLVIGHRGASAIAPENTLAAFKEALKQGVNMVELDVHLTKDDQIVVCHDQTIDRTTNGEGVIREMTLEKVQSFDAGSWFGDAFKGEKIPTLEEVINLFPADVWINVEVKNFYDGRLGEQLASLLKRTNRLHTVVVSSFYHKELVQFKENNPEVLVGILYNGRDLYDHVHYAQSLPVPIYSLHPNFKEIPESDIKKAIEHDIKIFPYTINEPEDMVALIEKGVTGLITDYPDRLQAIVKSL